MGIDIKVNAFEGPLDLLLHLIEKNKVDIYDIPISEITSQYLDYIRSMEEEDLDVMSDFLVMAATRYSTASTCIQRRDRSCADVIRGNFTEDF